MSFVSLNLIPPLLQALTDAGYEKPTPIQMSAIPIVLAGHDLMASAQTGTGKTAAFLLPALQRLQAPSAVQGRGPRVLVLTPTRELAAQVKDAASTYARHLGHMRIGSIVGGVPYPAQQKLLMRPLDVLVATPGRFLDHVERGRVDFSRLEIVILDEADRMLDMGFLQDVERIISATPATRQTVMFSATFEGSIATFAQRLLKNPQRIRIAPGEAQSLQIAQHVHYVNDVTQKKAMLLALLKETSIGQAIVFTGTKHGADKLALAIGGSGHAAAALHGDMRQGVRNRTLAQFRAGTVRVLVATDIAARGIDVAAISHVFNYDLPRSVEDYVHRIGRTGRAGQTGAAVSFATRAERGTLKRIERFTGQAIPTAAVPGFTVNETQMGSDEGAGRPTRPRSQTTRRPSNRPAFARSDSDRPSSGRPNSARPGSDRSSSGRPALARSGSDRPSSARPAGAPRDGVRRSRPGNGPRRSGNTADRQPTSATRAGDAPSRRKKVMSFLFG